MNRTLLPVVLATFSLLAACSASPDSDATSSAAAVSADTAPPVAVPVDGSYKGSCSDKFGSVDLTIDIANGAVSSISGTLEGRDGKFRVGDPVVSWTAPLTGTAQKIDATVERAIIQSAGTIAYGNETQVMQADEQTITTTATCSTSLSFSSIEIVPHNGAGNLDRSVIVHGVAASGATCDVANGPVDQNGDWWIDCAEDEGAVSSSGLDLLTAILRGAKPTP